MRTTTRWLVTPLAAALWIATQGAALAQQLQPGDLGVVEAPSAGAVPIPLAEVPLPIVHSAEVAFKQYAGGGTVLSAQVDKDEALAVYEIAGTYYGYGVEADIRADGVVLELELQVGSRQVPDAVSQALGEYAPGFQPEQPAAIEKSIRPSEIGLPEIWYEFSGITFDVEIRSDGQSVLIEPA